MNESMPTRDRIYFQTALSQCRSMDGLAAAMGVGVGTVQRISRELVGRFNQFERN
jgi:hypothetical protein